MPTQGVLEEMNSKMAKTIAVILMVSREDSNNSFQLNCRYIIASKIAPTPPSADDSVGVAMPAKIEPSTTRINARGGNIAISACLY